MSYCHTFCICDCNGNPVARCCSFKSSPLKKGHRCTVHKGKLVSQMENSDAVVKRFYCQDLNSCYKEVDAEVKKHNFVAGVLSQCPSADKKVVLVRTFKSEVEKVGKGSKLKGKMCGKEAALCEGDCLVVQDFVAGDIQDLFSISQRQACSSSSCPDFLLELVNMSYSLSRRRCVIAAIKGAVVSERRGREVKYLVTSLTIHSRAREYGDKDLGVEGVEMYERWSGQSPHVPPSAPPLDMTTDCGYPPHTHRESGSRPLSTHTPSTCSWTPQQPPRRPSREVWELYGNQNGSSFTAHHMSGCVDGDSVDSVDLNSNFSHLDLNFNCCPVDRTEGGLQLARRPTLPELLATTPELRDECPGWLLNNLLGPAPHYTSIALS